MKVTATLLVFALVIGLSSCSESHYSQLKNKHGEEFVETYKQAQNGNAKSQYEVGHMYFPNYENPSERILEQAFFWYQKSAKQGYEPAQFNLSIMLAGGYGCEQNLNAPNYWLEKSTGTTF